MNLRLIGRECFAWIFSVIIAALIWYPIFSKIPYIHLGLGMFAIVSMIQFFRWFVFYDQVIFFKRNYYKLASILIAFAIGAVVWSKGQEVLLIAENQAIEDIVPLGTKKIELGMEATYQLFAYLRNLLVFCNAGTPGLAFMFILKIIYKTIGLGSQKVKTYLGK
jgi:hypothetical protein